MADLTIQRNDAEHRYEGWSGDQLAGLLDYTSTETQIVFTHAETDPSFHGRGVASAVVRYALDEVRADATRAVVPHCPFVSSWIDRHPDYQSLLTAPTKGR